MNRYQKNRSLRLSGCIGGLKKLDLEEGGISFLEYTSMWLSKVDRGGLYHVTDMYFQILSEIGAVFMMDYIKGDKFQLRSCKMKSVVILMCHDCGT